MINDFIALTKNNNIDLRTKSEVDIVILGQCDKIMYRPKTTCCNCFIIFQPSLLNHQFLKGLNIPIKSLKQTFN
jgi:hypothetical protein